MKAVQDYLSLPYTMELRRDAEGDVVARIVELPGCVTHAQSEGEAAAALREVQTIWIQQALNTGVPIARACERTAAERKVAPARPADSSREVVSIGAHRTGQSQPARHKPAVRSGWSEGSCQRSPGRIDAHGSRICHARPRCRSDLCGRLARRGDVCEQPNGICGDIPRFVRQTRFMKFPEIVHCLICEDVRPEPNKKLSILGFFGIAPNVEIRLDVDKPMERLTLVLLCGPSEPGAASLTATIQHEDGTKLVSFDGVAVQLPKSDKINLTLAAINVPVPKHGKYQIVVTEDGTRVFISEFLISQWSPDDSRQPAESRRLG